MADLRKVAKAVTSVITPPVNRLDMSYKDVTKRVPELTEAAQKLARGEITAADYAALVNKAKPVTPYSFVPQPATAEDATKALDKNKRLMFGKTAEIAAGEPTALRLDIPAYQNHGVWVNSVHREGQPTVYGAVSSVKNATMSGAPEKAMRVATGEASKGPWAVIRGEWNPMDEAAAVKSAQQYLKSKEWRQVGYDPERHGYFYDRETMAPVLGAEEVIQIGPLVLAKKPKYGDPKDFPFKKGGRAMAGGGIAKLAKAVTSVIKQDVLPAEERAANLAKMLEGSKVKERLYHATPADIAEFKPGGNDPTLSGPAIWMTPNAENQPAAHNIKRVPGQSGRVYRGSQFTPGTNVMPLYANIKNPLISTEETWKSDFAKVGGGSPWVLSPEEVASIRAAGHDGVFYYDKNGKLTEVLAFQPEQVKSAIGNRGTYDVTKKDITKAKGGRMAGGGIAKAAKALTSMIQDTLPAAERKANLDKLLEPSKVKERLYHSTTATEGGKGAEAIRRLKPSKDGSLGSGVYLTPSSARSSHYSGSPSDEALAMMLVDPYQQDAALRFLNRRSTGNVLPEQVGGNMLPVYAQIKNPLVLEGKGDPMIEALMKLGLDEAKASRMVERAYENKGYIGKEVESRARAAGYDGLMQYRDGKLSEVVSYNPNAVKSATGNRGTYDINDPELSRRKGGSVKMAGGGIAKAAKALTSAIKEASNSPKPAKKRDAMAEILESKTPPMTTPMGTGLPLMPRTAGMYRPDVPQVDLPRMPKVDKARAAGVSPEYTKRMQDLLDSRTAQKKVDELILKGQDLGMREWYGTEPLRQVAKDIDLPEEKWQEFLGQMASASQRNPVDKQNQMGSYLWHLSQTGQLPKDAFLLTKAMKEGKREIPTGTAIELPEGYGSLAQSDIVKRARKIAHEGVETALPPNVKLGTFYRNLAGNLQPVTVDVNALRGPVIARGDPRWLASKVTEKDDDGNVISSMRPREMYESGEISLKQARERPGLWEAAPSGSEYAGFEDLWQKAAKRHGVAPAEAQALGWYGSGDITALKTKPELYVDNLERLIRRTAEQTGKSPKQVMEDMLTGKGFLRKDGGAVEGGSFYEQFEAALKKHGGMAAGGPADTRPDVTDGGNIIQDAAFAKGGQIKFKGLRNRKKFDKGGVAFSDPLSAPDAPADPKVWGSVASTIEGARKALEREFALIKDPKTRADIMKRIGLQGVGSFTSIPGTLMGTYGALKEEATAPVMRLLGKKPRTVEGAIGEPMAEALSGDALIEEAKRRGMVGEAEAPILETATGLVAPFAAAPAARVAKAAPRAAKGLVNAMVEPVNPRLAQRGSVSLGGLPQEGPSTTGVSYATKQEGPFFRVRPVSPSASSAKGRGVREADELQGSPAVGGGAGSSGSTVPTRLSDEEVARIIADPAANEPLNIAKKYTQETQGTEFTLPQMPESSLVKQSAIGRVQEIASEGSPEYKRAIFDAYAREMPEVLEQSGAKNYDDLMEKAYRQMAKETDAQFQALPYNFSYHRAGEGNYLSSNEMAADVHGNKHLYVYQGGDKHDFLNRIDPVTGLNENEKFRAVHDLLGHAIYGNQFGPKGEEVAWAVHSQMYSPLARLAMTAETRGQNSMVNYSPLNANLKAEIAKYDSLASEARRRGDTALLNEINAAKRQAYSGWQYAPNKAVLLPPEFLSPQYAGGMPSYLEAVNLPVKGTEVQSALTHFSHAPDLQFVDPRKYGTGIKGAEAQRLRDYPGGVKERSYFYMGEPGAVRPEPGLGVHRYRGESSSLYDVAQDPLGLRVLAREANRTPFTAKSNQGMVNPMQEANDIERLVREYGYQGMANPRGAKPMAIMFKETPVSKRARGGLAQVKGR